MCCMRFIGGAVGGEQAQAQLIHRGCKALAGRDGDLSSLSATRLPMGSLVPETDDAVTDPLRSCMGYFK